MHPTLQALQIGDDLIEYCVAGTGPALVLVHGGSCTAEDWFPLLPQLKDHFRVVMPDGLIHPLDPWRTWLLLDYLQIETAALLGHSAGGMLIRQMYRLMPERVKAMVSIDSGAAVVEGSMTLARRLPNDRFSPEAAALYARNRVAMEKLRPHHQGDYPSEATILCRMRAYRRQSLSPEERGVGEGRASPQPERYQGPIPDCPEPVSDQGKFIRCPVQIYQTGRGKLGPEDITEEWKRQNVQAEDAEYIVIKEAGHWPWLESADLLLQPLLRFLEKVRRA